MSRLKIAIALSVLLLGHAANAYELETHSDVSAAAAGASVLDAYLTNELHILSTRRIDLKTRTYAGNDGTAVGWMREGSVREDDSVLNLSPSQRPLNHFFNPLNGQGLFLLGFGLPQPAPSWALEDTESYGTQQFSMRDARQYFYDALTSQNPVFREHDLASTFRAIGQVIHVLEDMAQPQHTRNDLHFPWAQYEAYTEDNRVRASLPFVGFPSSVSPVRKAVYDTEDPTTFNAPRNFWHTDAKNGLADYSNRGFVSEGTNFVTNPVFTAPAEIVALPDLPEPNGTSAVFWQPAIDALTPCKWTDAAYEPHGLLAFVQTTVHDSYTDSDDINEMTSTESIFDADLDAVLQPKTFTLNCYTFEAAHQLLIPRAVGYSAGLINYFFRGKLNFGQDPSDPNGYVITNLGPEDLDGTFTLYADTADGTRSKVPGGEWPRLIPSEQCGVGCNQVSVQAFGVPFNPPANSRYTLVFHGEMGNETVLTGGIGAVAGKVVQAESFVLGTSSAAYQTAFGDRAWQRRRDPLPAFSNGTFIRNDLMFLVGSSLSRSTDGGATFADVGSSLVSGGDTVLRVIYLGNNQLLAESSSAWSTFYSDDLGLSWSENSNPDGVGIVNTSYVGEGEVIGESYVVTPLEYAFGLASSLDGGATWSPVPLTIGGRRLQTCDASPAECGVTGFDSFALQGPITWNQKDGSERVLLMMGAWYRLPPPLPVCVQPPRGECILFGDGTFWCPPPEEPLKQCPSWDQYEVESGVFKSTDGLNWHLVYSNNIIEYFVGDVVVALAQSADGTALMVRTVFNWFVNHLELLQSHDGGETWQVATVPPGLIGSASEGYVGLAWMGNDIDSLF